MAKTYKIAVIPGDGIGKEVTPWAQKALEKAAEGVADFEYENFDLGAERYLRDGAILPEDEEGRIKANDAILLGAVGDPRIKAGILERGLLLKLRFDLDQYVNLRPSKLYKGVTSPLANPGDIDFVVVREGTEGLYCGAGGAVRRNTPQEVATEVSINTAYGVERVVRYAFKLAMKRKKHVTLVHKKNVLVNAGDMWQRIVDKVGEEYPEVTHDYQHIDAATIFLVSDPSRFDVILTDNLFGDILTDEAGSVVGGVGYSASGCINASDEFPSMFEPIHGSAPDIAGQNKANPTAAILSAIVAAPLCYFILGPENNCWGIFIAILCGLIGGTLIGYFTEYFTSDNYKPTKKLAAASETGAATIIIGGISLGLMSTIASILIVAVAILISYFAAGGTTSILDEMGGFSLSFNQGLYGIGIAGVGMLSTLGITLATDAYGPVADNAGGIAEMSGLPEEVRDRTDALDSLGNTTAATGKGFAIGSASLTALALLVSYVNIVQDRTVENLNFTLTSPTVLVGLFIGAMLTFVFSAMTMRSVQTAAQSIVVEVRRQFREIAGIMEGKTDPEYGKCVALCTKGALHEMVAPALLAIIVPIITGLILGPTGVVGLLGGVSVTGFAMAVFMSNAGGAWDNAKKYIERGNHGGKGSEQHKAAVVGDTVGDPFKDTSGPSLNILIKLCSTVSIVFSGLVLAFHLL